MAEEKKLTFAKAFKRLEEIALFLENSEIELEEAEKLVEEAKKMDEFCRRALSAQKLKISNFLTN